MKKLYSFLLGSLLASPAILSFFPDANRYELIREITPMLVLGILAVIFSGCFLFKAWKEGALKRKLSTSVPLAFFFTGFVLWSVLGFLLGEVKSFGFAEIFVLFMAGLWIFTLSKEPKLQQWLPWALGSMLILATGMGLYGFFTTDHARFAGFFYDPAVKADAWPNAYASFFLLCFPFYIYALNDSGRFLKGWGWYLLRSFLTALVLAGFLLTLSRGAFLAAFIVLFLLVGMIFTQGRGRLFLKGSLWIHGLLPLLLTFAFTSTLLTLKDDSSIASERLTFTEVEGGNSASERLQFFTGSLELIAERPFLGTGPSSFRFVYPAVQEGFLAPSDHPHNVLLKWGVERGVPAVFLFLAFLGLLFTYTHPFRSKADPLLTVSWLSVLGLMAHHMIDYNLNFLTLTLVFFFVLALLVGRTPATAWASARLGAVMMGSFFLAVVFSGFRLAYDEHQFNRLVLIDPADGAELLSSVKSFYPLLPAWELYEKVGETQGSLREEWILKQIEFNPRDAEAWAWLAAWQWAQNDLQGARESYEMALTVNPKNTFRYYLDYARLLKALDEPQALKDLSALLKPLLEEYEALYAINLHYTQATEEKEWADALRGL